MLKSFLELKADWKETKRSIAQNEKKQSIDEIKKSNPKLKKEVEFAKNYSLQDKKTNTHQRKAERTSLIKEKGSFVSIQTDCQVKQ